MKWHKNRGKRSGDGLPGADTALVRTRCIGWPLFIAVHCVEATRATPGKRKGDDGRRDGGASVLTWCRGAAAKGAA
jgi:hypothetical protein